VGRAGVTWGWRERQIRLLVGASFVQFGFLMWGWYAWQPYLLELLKTEAVWIAGVIAAATSLATICGNGLVEYFTRFCGKRTTLLLWASGVHTAAAIGVGLAPSFGVALALLLLVMGSLGVVAPVKQSYLHQVVPTEHRATVVSFDSMIGNAGGIAGQMSLGVISRTWSIATGYIVGGAATVLAVPLFFALRRMARPVDTIVGKARRHGPCAGHGLPEIATVDPKARVAEPATAAT
jgi:predicted MFS family arabinose efflux permease